MRKTRGFGITQFLGDALDRQITGLQQFAGALLAYAPLQPPETGTGPAQIAPEATLG